MRYRIVVNPAAGTSSIDKKMNLLGMLTSTLQDCAVSGMDTTNAEEFRECVRYNAERDPEVIVLCGGDGTMLDGINALDDISDIRFAYFPLGTGNMLKASLGYPFRSSKIAQGIRDGREHSLDLILCDNGTKTLLASVGLEGPILKVREDYLQDLTDNGKYVPSAMTGFKAYGHGVCDVVVSEGVKTPHTRVEVDGRTELDYGQTLTVIVTKLPFYGYLLKICPKAKLDDGKLHVQYAIPGRTNFGTIAKVGCALATSWMQRNMVGTYVNGEKVEINTDRPQLLNMNGTVERDDKGEPIKRLDYCFKVLPGALKMVY